jgi:hypothetical protein
MAVDPFRDWALHSRGGWAYLVGIKHPYPFLALGNTSCFPVSLLDLRSGPDPEDAGRLGGATTGRPSRLVCPAGFASILPAGSWVGLGVCWPTKQIQHQAAAALRVSPIS